MSGKLIQEELQFNTKKNFLNTVIEAIVLVTSHLLLCYISVYSLLAPHLLLDLFVIVSFTNAYVFVH